MLPWMPCECIALASQRCLAPGRQCSAKLFLLSIEHEVQIWLSADTGLPLPTRIVKSDSVKET